MLHLAMIREMIQWVFAYDHQNYARYLPLYYSEMTRLNEDHPDVHDHYVNDIGFTVQMGPQNFSPGDRRNSKLRTPRLMAEQRALASSLPLCANTI